MELPEDVCRLIHEFALPLTRGDWRKGSYIKRNYDNFDNDMGYVLENNHFSMLICNEVEYINYLSLFDGESGYMILNFKPTFQQMEKVFNNRYQSLYNFHYEQHEKTYIIRRDYIEMIEIC